MKRLSTLLFILVTGISLSWATDGYYQHLSPEEFRSKQKAFIIEKAGLTTKEADKFFPIYFELQDKKKEINDKIGKLMRQGRDEKTTEAQYEKIVTEIYDLRIASDQLDKTYFNKYKEVLSFKKIYLVQKAETRFHREILKGVHRKGGDGNKPPQQKSKDK